MRRLLSALGVDYVQWRALTIAALKLDLRAGGGAVAAVNNQRGGSGMAILGRLFSYALLGVVMALAAAFIGDRFAASMVVLSYVTVVVATAMLVDLNAVILSPTDYGVLGAQPISSRTYFAAKLTNILVYTLALATLVGMLPTLVLLVKHGVLPGLAGIAALYACAVTVTLAIVAGYARLARAVGVRRLRNALSWVQLVLSVGIYGGFFVISEIVGRSALAGFTLPWSPWLLLYPGTWFASYAELAAGAGGWLHLAGVLASLALMALLAGAMHGRLSLEYAEQLGTLMASGGDTRAARAAGSRPRLWFRAGEARAVAILVRGQFRNDLRFRMGVLAIIPLTVVYLLMGVNDAREAGAATPDLALLSVAILLFPAVLRSNLAASDAFRASWIYFATPADRARLIRSARDILAVFFLLPYLALVGVTLAFLIDDRLWLLAYLALAGLMSNLMLLVATLLNPELPFARPHEKMQETSRVLLVMILAGVLGIFLMKLVDWLYGDPVALATTFAVVIAASVLVGRLTRARIERQAARLEFEG
ncbi:MAG TPA: hypothetical protein VIL18_10470 [Longimicrobiales bacterium]